MKNHLVIHLLLLLLAAAAQTKAQKIYTIAGGKGAGCKLHDADVGYRIHMALDKNNNIYAADYDDQYGLRSIRKYDFQNNSVTNITADDGDRINSASEPASEVFVDHPYSIIFNKNESLFITDYSQHRILTVDKKGILSVTAGNGIAGFSGDSGLAKNAQLYSPTDIVFDKNGNLYIADSKNNRIRKVNKKGIITTFAGTGSNVYNGDEIPAKEAALTPGWLTFDSKGNLYVYDASSRRIRKIDTAGIIHIFAGNGNSTSFYPPDTVNAKHTALGSVYNILADDKDNIYFISTYVVYKISQKGLMTRFAGGGSAPYGTDNIPATSVHLSEPPDLCLGAEGDIYITEDGYITKVDTNNIFHIVLGGDDYIGAGDPIKEAVFPGRLAVNPFTDSLYVFDGYRIFVADRQTGLYTLKAGNGGTGYSGNGGLAVNATFLDIENICFDKNGNSYLADQSANTIRKIDKNGIVTKVAGTTKKGFSGDGSNAINAQLNEPTGVAIDANGNLYIADYGNNRIRKIDAITHIITTIAGDGGQRFTGDGGPATAASLFLPYDIAFDNNENFYIADSRNQRIRKIDKNGIITTVAGNGSFHFNGNKLATQTGIGKPVDIAFDKNNNLYICDDHGSHIYKVDLNNIITNYAGNSNGSLEDGISPEDAYLNYPERIAIDSTQNLYIADYDHAKEVFTNCNAETAAKQHTFVLKYINKPETLKNGCDVVCTIAPQFNIVNSLNSLVSSEVWIENNVIKLQDFLLAPRHYELWPQIHPFTAKSVVTLYFTQKDFNEYNKAASTTYTLLPMSRRDTSDIKNLRILFYSDTIHDQNKVPKDFASKTQTLNPDDENIIWNDSLQCWQATINVAGLGNFYVTSTAASQTTAVQYASANDKLLNSISIYPNPVKDMVTVQIPDDLLFSALQIIAQDGKILSSQKLNSATTQISLKSFAAGLYTFKFTNGTNKKVIKE